MTEVRAYIAGGGLAALSTAFYLIRDGDLKPGNITVFEESDFCGGGLDAFSESSENGYFMRGFRMLEDKVYSALFDLMSEIPSLEDHKKTLMEEFTEFNKEVKTCALSRLVENGKAIDSRPLKMTFSDRLRLLKLLSTPEKKLQNISLEEYFSPKVFESNFWYEFATTFSFQPWHSAEELKRYILRFLQDAPVLHTQTCIRSTKYNQYESIALPTMKFLEEKGVVFVKNSAVTDVKFIDKNEKSQVSQLTVMSKENVKIIEVEKNDLVFLSLGSMVADYSVGSMDSRPAEKPLKKSISWDLWEKTAQISPEFGNPFVFNQNIDKTKWTAFTVTFSDPLFFDMLQTITKRKAGEEGPVTIKDSNWLISFAVPNQPHFIGQPENLQVLWGYGLYPDKKGNFINKKMSDCTGREILNEIVKHLKFDEHLDKILDSANSIPCTMPYITSQFMPRKLGDRPQVVPSISENFAFIGQYCEIPEDIVFTLEYSVRSGQIAVGSLLKTGRKPTPIYRGRRNLKHVFNIIRTAFR
jgi:oleate hydratase